MNLVIGNLMVLAGHPVFFHFFPSMMASKGIAWSAPCLFY